MHDLFAGQLHAVAGAEGRAADGSQRLRARVEQAHQWPKWWLPVQVALLVVVFLEAVLELLVSSCTVAGPVRVMPEKIWGFCRKYCCAGTQNRQYLILQAHGHVPGRRPVRVAPAQCITLGAHVLHMR